MNYSYEICFTKVAKKFFVKHQDVLEQYKLAIKELLVGKHPESIDVKRIHGKNGIYYRIRLGEYRVIYALINGKIVVVNTLLAGSRGDVYKKLSNI